MPIAAVTPTPSAALGRHERGRIAEGDVGVDALERRNGLEHGLSQRVAHAGPNVMLENKCAQRRGAGPVDVRLHRSGEPERVGVARARVGVDGVRGTRARGGGGGAEEV